MARGCFRAMVSFFTIAGLLTASADATTDFPPTEIILTIDVPSVNITTPNYPSFYPNALTLIWLVTAPQDFAVGVEILDFQMEKHSLAKDGLTVGDGLNFTLNGYYLPSDAAVGDAGSVRRLISSGPRAWLLFDSDKKLNERGFKIRLSVVDQTDGCFDEEEFACNEEVLVCMDGNAECDGYTQCTNETDERYCDYCGQTEIDISHGKVHTLTSPNYPNEFPNKIDCYWLIYASDNASILLSFVKISLLEETDGVRLGIGEDPSNNASELLMRRGSVAPSTVAIQSDRAWVVFSTSAIDLNTQSIVEIDVLEFQPKVCEDNQFACQSGLDCIHETAVCDGLPECSDHSDEFNCDSCLSDNSPCWCAIEQADICNGLADCPDWYDELYCEICGEPFIQLASTTTVKMTSPNYPSLYPTDTECLYVITAQPEHRVLLRFADFKLGIETFSLGHGVDPANASSVIMRRSGATTPGVVTSEDTAMWMTFQTTNGYPLFRGYSLEVSQFVTVVCDVDQFPCRSGLECVMSSDRCDDVTDCLDFSDETGCGSCDPDEFLCTGVVCVDSADMCNGYVDCPDFRDETGCGDLCGERNIMLNASSPNYTLASADRFDPLPYPPGYSCLWVLTTDHAELQVALTVDFLSLLARVGDTIEIGNGRDPSLASTTIAILDGGDDNTAVGKTYLSSGQTMWVAMLAKPNEGSSNVLWGAFVFTTSRYNDSGPCDGKRCEYSSHCVPSNAVCDGIGNCFDFTDEQGCEHCGGEATGTINISESAQYVLTARLTSDVNFNLGKDCLWLVTALPGWRIELNFFYLVLISDTHYTNGIMIGDGRSSVDESSLLLAHTGRSVQQVVTSSGSEMWVVAYTTFLQYEEGFSAVLSQYQDKECSVGQYACPSGLKCIDEAQRCDGVPDCPEVGDEFGCADCAVDQLHCDTGTCVDRDNVCDGTDECVDALDERICAPCGDNIINLPRDQEEPIIFESPSYPITEYPSSMDCHWLITVRDDLVVQLEFLVFVTELKYDTLSVGNGHDLGNLSTAILAGISGEEAPRIAVSDVHLMWVRFVTDLRVADVGFQLEISQINQTEVVCRESEAQCASGPGLVCLSVVHDCNGIALCPDGSDEDEATCGLCGSKSVFLFGMDVYNLTSPGYPSDYPVDLSCTWLIKTYEKPPITTEDDADIVMWRVVASIEDFELENQYDYLSLYNWDGESATDLIASLTGTVRLTTVASSGPVMFVKFKNDKTGPAGGFKIRFQPSNLTDGFCKEPDFDCLNNQLCVSSEAPCNGFNDCLEYQDETDCGDVQCPGNYECYRQINNDEDLARYQCITKDLVCNGQPDCPEKDDEEACDEKKCPSECDCYYDSQGLVVNCVGSWQQETVDSMAQTVYTLSLNGGNVTEVRAGTFKGMKWMHTLSLRDNNIESIMPTTFDGLDNLTWLELSSNNIKQLQSYSFQELGKLVGLTLWNVSLMRIEEAAFQGLSNLNRLELIRGGIETPLDVAPKGFDGLDSLQSLYVDDHQICCYFQEAPLVTCISIEPRPPLFMCSNLMPNTVLRVFMWILGISALIGNFGIMLWRLHEKNSKSSKIVHSSLVFNLAVADFLMGVYMIIIAAADVHYGDEYFMHATEWRSSVTCKIASTLSILSSEASVFIITLITIDRFLCIVLPFSQFHLRRKSSCMILAAIWCVTLTVSLVPTLLADEESNFYGLSDVCIGLPLMTRPTGYTTNTEDFGSPFSNASFAIPVALAYEPSWVFSIVLFLGVNLVCFLVILGCYIAIFVHVQLSLKQVKRHMHRHDEIKMAGKMALIVGTDLVCWLPIIIMGILAQSNAIVIPSTMYAWCVVFILPINSSLNPYLYTVSSCLADRKRVNMPSTVTTKRNGTVTVDKINLDNQSVNTQEVNVVI